MSLSLATEGHVVALPRAKSISRAYFLGKPCTCLRKVVINTAVYIDLLLELAMDNIRVCKPLERWPY